MNDSPRPRRRSPQRILDASLNRAMEAARVLDDAARFLLDDAAISERLKRLRHDLRALMEAMPTALHLRDVEGDVGTEQATDEESIRRSPADVAHAAGHRLAESLRSVEEWVKLVDPEIAEFAKTLRYRGYALHQAVASALPGTAPQWRVCVLVTESICRRPWEEVVVEAVAGGADAVQLREKSLGDRELLARARRMTEIVEERADVIINDRVDIALLAGAHGVHLGDADLAVSSARAIAGHQLILGVSTHTPVEADAAIAAGADMIGIGTIFASATKPRAVAGPDLLAAVLRTHPEVAHLAIGGIDAERARQLRAIGCRGVAVSAAICGAEDPRQAARELADAMTEPDPPN